MSLEGTDANEENNIIRLPDDVLETFRSLQLGQIGQEEYPSLSNFEFEPVIYPSTKAPSMHVSTTDNRPISSRPVIRGGVSFENRASLIVATKASEEAVSLSWTGVYEDTLGALQGQSGQIEISKGTRFIVRGGNMGAAWVEGMPGYNLEQANLDPLRNPEDIGKLNSICASVVEIGDPNVSTYGGVGQILAVKPTALKGMYRADAGGNRNFPKPGDDPIGMCLPDELLAATAQGSYNEVHVMPNPDDVKVVGYFISPSATPEAKNQATIFANIHGLPLVVLGNVEG